MKILIVKPSSLGDIVHSIPTAIALSRFLGYEVSWLVFDRFAQILPLVKDVRKIIIWRRYGGAREWVDIVGKVRALKFDAVADLQGITRSALVTALSGAKIRVSVPLQRELAPLLVGKVGRYKAGMHRLEVSWEVARFFAKREGVELPAPVNLLPWIDVPPDAVEDAKELVKRNFSGRKFSLSRLFVVSPTTRGGEKRRWKGFAELLRKVKKSFDLVPVVVGARGEEKVCGEVVRFVDEYVMLAGMTDVRVLCGVLKLARFAVGNDSAVVHICAGLGKPVLEIMGPTHPYFAGPYTPLGVWVWSGCRCSGVFKPICKTSNFCIDSVSVEDVFRAFERVLEISEKFPDIKSFFGEG